ncbi:MAG: hypothetical protein ACYTAN_18275 [Planctomycetota bacterium]|jgi:hypothetical protein
MKPCRQWWSAVITSGIVSAIFLVLWFSCFGHLYTEEITVPKPDGGAVIVDVEVTYVRDVEPPDEPADPARPVGFLLWQPPDQDQPAHEEFWQKLTALAELTATHPGITVCFQWGHPFTLRSANFARVVPLQARWCATVGWQYQVRISTSLTSPEAVASLDDWENVWYFEADSETKEHDQPTTYQPWRHGIPAHIRCAMNEGIGYGSIGPLRDTQEFVVSWSRMGGDHSGGEWGNFRPPTNINAITFLAREMGASLIKIGPQLYNTSFHRQETDEMLRAGVFLAAQEALAGADIELDVSGWGFPYLDDMSAFEAVFAAIDEVNALGITTDAKPLPAEVGILWEREVQLYSQHTQVFWHMVFASGVEHRMIRHGEDLSGLRAVLIPHSDDTKLPAATVEWLRDFGGLVITECAHGRDGRYIEQTKGHIPDFMTLLPSYATDGKWVPSISRFFYGWNQVDYWPPATSYQLKFGQLLAGYCALLGVEPPADIDIIRRRFTMDGRKWLWTVNVTQGNMTLTPY